MRRGEECRLAEWVELAPVPRGRTVDDALANVQEAAALSLQGEDMAEPGLAANRIIVVTIEQEPADA